ncbi:HK97 gp10 family phage protein [Enterococcus sp. AZ051]|uniref:HK97 gp10 family phage protein n=1 Tax=Enterococcus sp. AZ051 TaxID=2774698 RepID=UPI003D2CAF95
MGVTIKGLDALKAKLDSLPKIVESGVVSATSELTEDVLSRTQLRIQSSTKHASGELAGSYKEEVVVNASNVVVGRVWSDKDTALFRELGTGPVGEESEKDLPQGINPVYTQEAWFVPVDQVAVDLEAVYGIPRITIQGKDFYMTRGQPARPALYPSLKEVAETAEEVYEEHINKAVKSIGK